MKRNLTLIGATLLLAFVAVLVDEGVTAEKPKGSDIQGSVTSTTTMDTTVLRQSDTIQTETGSDSKLMWFTEAGDYSTLTGWFLSEYTALDSGAAAANICDTSADTVTYRIYTSDADGTPYKLIWSGSSADFNVTDSVTNDDYVTFNVSDSTHWDALYLEIIPLLSDSTPAAGRAPTADIKWKHSWHLYAK